MKLLTLLIVCACACRVSGAAAQPVQPAQAPRTFDLAALQQAALDADPRAAQVRLLAAQSELRQRNIQAGRLPLVSVDGQAQYQSHVPQAPLAGPTGAPLFAPPKATFDGSVRVEQRLFDPTIDAQRAVEQAQLSEQQARVSAVLFPLRQQITEAYFAALLVQARASALASAITDLEGRLREAQARVTEGTALPADAAAIEAAVLQRRQEALELRANRRSALSRLTTLTGVAIADGDTLSVPRLDAAVARARADRADGADRADRAAARARPEFTLYERTRERLERQRRLSVTQERPRVSTYGRVGLGRPGLNFIDDEPQVYGLGGLRVQWNAWNWGVPARERAALAEQQRITEADEAAFARGLRDAVQPDEAALDRLVETLSIDDRIIALREQVARSTDVRYREGVVTVSEYLGRVAELEQARFAKADHEVQLAQAGARLLTTLGLEVR